MTKAMSTIGEYEIERELGRGAFGVVYRAHHKNDPGTPIALKVVKGQGNTDRLLLEPAVLSKLDHPCIVGLEDYFLHGDDLVLALEFIDGVDLKTLLDQGQHFTEADVRDLMIQVGSALASAHAKNVLHRDIKPANILVTRLKEGNYRFVLTDFGIGQVREGIQHEKQAGGTYLYMAPEQMRGRPGPQSDLWALGVVAYRMLTGALPFPGPTLPDLTRQILYASPVPPSEVLKRPVDPELERATLSLLDKSLAERTASADALLAELGHRGPVGSVLNARPKTGKPPKGGRSLDRELEGGIRTRAVLLGASILFYLLPTGLISGLLSLLGLWLFFRAQRRPKGLSSQAVGLTLLSFVALGGYVTLRYFLPLYDFGIVTSFAQLQQTVGVPVARLLFELFGPAIAQFLGVIVLVLGLALLILHFCMPIVAGALFAKLRRLQREKLLRDLAREGDAASDQYLVALRDSLESRYEDVGLHLKFAEALYARGRVDEAAAECRLLLRQDPYNFNGNLMLANAYQALGLHRDCARVCEDYLAVSGYCFEFSELRDQSERRAAA